MKRVKTGLALLFHSVVEERNRVRKEAVPVSACGGLFRRDLSCMLLGLGAEWLMSFHTVLFSVNQ